MYTKPRMWWQQLRRYLGSTLLILTGLALISYLIILGYNADWTGFGQHVEIGSSNQQIQPAKTFWDWMQLFIIPFALVLAAFLLNLTNSRIEQAIALDKQREELLQSYIDRMSDLLLEKKLRTSVPDDEARNVARVRTLTILFQLDTRRIDYIITFLRESGLATSNHNTSIVTFSKADLRTINLSHANIHTIDLSDANLSNANLFKINLSDANLSNANLSKANLRNANLSGTNLRGADLSNANLSNANLSTAPQNKGME